MLVHSGHRKSLFHVCAQWVYKLSRIFTHPKFGFVTPLAKIKSSFPIAQHHLDFGAPNFAPETFLHSPQSMRPWTALKTWGTWPGGVFCLCGETGAGKSHLGNMWAQTIGAPVILGKALDTALVSKMMDGGLLKVLIDNADECDEAALFTLLTALERDGGAVLLIAATPPGLWPFELRDLKSRLNSIAFEVMTAPEPALLAKLIIRHGAAAGFRIDEDASQYLAARIPRTFKATHDVIACMQNVDSATLKSPKALAQRALHALYTQAGYEDRETTPDLFEL
jgi:chromosomal replication initiation ATPase DnaA